MIGRVRLAYGAAFLSSVLAVAAEAQTVEEIIARNIEVRGGKAAIAAAMPLTPLRSNEKIGWSGPAPAATSRNVSLAMLFNGTCPVIAINGEESA